jgi:hypothetical protein
MGCSVFVLRPRRARRQGPLLPAACGPAIVAGLEGPPQMQGAGERADLAPPLSPAITAGLEGSPCAVDARRKARKAPADASSPSTNFDTAAIVLAGWNRHSCYGRSGLTPLPARLRCRRRCRRPPLLSPSPTSKVWVIELARCVHSNRWYNAFCLELVSAAFGPDTVECQKHAERCFLLGLRKCLDEVVTLAGLLGRLSLG